MRTLSRAEILRRLYGVEIVEGARMVEDIDFIGHSCAFMMGNEVICLVFLMFIDGAIERCHGPSTACCRVLG